MKSKKKYGWPEPGDFLAFMFVFPLGRAPGVPASSFVRALFTDAVQRARAVIAPFYVSLLVCRSFAD